MSQMLKSSGAMGLATLTSRVLGMVREMVYAAFMGDGPVAGAFKLAFKIPNLFRRLLGEGALTAAFIPIFKDKEKNAGEAEMWRSANAVISGLVVASAVVVGVAMLGVSLALKAGSFSAQTKLMLELLWLMFPYLLLVCLTAIFMGMLNARGHFFIPAMGAATLNVVMIASVLWLAPRFGATLEQQIFALAIGVLVAGVAQAVFQLPSLRREGFRYQWVAPWKNETVRQVVVKMVPGALGVAAFQINVLLTDGVAFFVDPQIVASFDYAVRLMELPQGVFGISLATYLLTALSGLAAEKKHDQFCTELRSGLGHLLFVNLIMSILLMVLAEPIIRLLFERREFTGAATERAAFALVCLAPGLVAFSMVNILARAFYALGDTQTPMKISIVCLAINLVFAIPLVFPLRQGGLGIANSISAIFNVWLLLHALRRKLDGRLNLTPLRSSTVSLLGAGCMAGLAAWGAHSVWDSRLGHGHLWTKLGAVFVPAGIAGLIYFAAALGFRVASAREILNVAAGRFQRQPTS
jgi:putative peptidoglycan lipid II flippase